MLIDNHDYSLFLKFIETFPHIGFRGIDNNDPLVMELAVMGNDNQFSMLET